MSRSKRILLCRLGVVLLCILPTTGVAGWIVSRGSGHRAASKAEWERELSSRLGLIAEIGDVTYSAAGAAQLQQVRLLDPASADVVAEAATIEVTQAADGWTVEATGFSLESSGLPDLCRTVNDRLLQGQTPLNIRWLPRDAILKGDSSGQTLAQLSASFQSDAAGSRFEMAFLLPGQAERDQPIRVGASRTDEQNAAVTRWQVNSAGQSLPCWIAAPLAPEIACLGRECAFRGELFVTHAEEQWRSELAGTLAGVDLDALVTENFPHQFSGAATVNVERAVFERGRLTELRGQVHADRGAIGASLLAAAADHLKLEPGSDVAKLAPTASVAYSHLAIDFEISGAWLSVAGNADPKQPGTLLANRNGMLLRAPHDHAVTTAGLLRTLVSDSEHQVPATQQTAALVRMLPLPDVSPAAQRMPSHTPTRLSPAAAQVELEAEVRQPVLR